MDSNFRFRVRCKRDLVKAIIVGFVCKPPSPDYLPLLSARITEGRLKRSLRTVASLRAEPEVRIHFPPAASQANFELAWQMRFGDDQAGSLTGVRQKEFFPVTCDLDHTAEPASNDCLRDNNAALVPFTSLRTAT
jgi:hypothetical protein